MGTEAESEDMGHLVELEETEFQFSEEFDVVDPDLDEDYENGHLTTTVKMREEKDALYGVKISYFDGTEWTVPSPMETVKVIEPIPDPNLPIPTLDILQTRRAP